MSGWIKYSTNLHNKPRVQRIADELKISRFDAAGRLCAVWVWADTMTENGVIEFGTLAQVDRAAEIKGFGEAMIRVGWLRQDGDNLVIPDWELHHSASAKRRSDGAKRAAKLRHEKAEKTPKEPSKSGKRARRAHEGVRDVRTKSAPRGEERREEENGVAGATPTTSSSCDRDETSQATPTPEPSPSTEPASPPTAAGLLEPFGYAAAAAETIERAVGLGVVVDIVESYEAIRAEEPGKIKNPNGWVRSMVAAAREGRFEVDPRVLARRKAERSTDQIGAERERRMSEAAELDERSKAEADRVASLVDGLDDGAWADLRDRVIEETRGTIAGELLARAVAEGTDRISKTMRLRVAELLETEEVA